MIKHTFVSAQPDSGDPNEVSADEWNADHTIDDAAAVKAALAITTSDVSGLTAALAAKADTSALDDVAFSGNAGQLQTGTLLAARMPAFTGPVTTSAGSVATSIATDAIGSAQIAADAVGTSEIAALAVTTAKIADDAVTYAKLQNASATARILARITAGAGDWEEATAAQILTMLGISSSVATDGQFGDGSTGTHTMDGSTAVTNCSLAGSTYTATGPCFFDLLTLNVGVNFKPDGWPIFFKQKPTINGIIDCSGGNASGSTAGTGAVSGTRRLPVNMSPGNTSTDAPQVFSNSGGTGGPTAGGAGTSGANGTAGVTGRGGGGGAGGNNNPFTAQGAAGSDGPAVTLALAANGDIREPALGIKGMNHAGTKYTPGTAGGNGGDGGAGTTHGGQGAAGGWMVLCAPGFLGSGTIRANGGNGGNGTAGGAGIGGAGGGGGGAGGFIVIVTAGGGVVPTVQANGGTGGSGGAGGSGPSGNGGNGGNGGAGYVLTI